MENTLTGTEHEVDNDCILCLLVKKGSSANFLLLVCVYFPPGNSSLANNENYVWSELESHINNKLSNGTILICGDLNARLGTKGREILLPDSSLASGKLKFISILDVDKHLNQRGKSIKEFCSINNLAPLNGLQSFSKKLSSEFTCFTYNGCSVVDWFLCQQSEVGRFLDLSFASLLNFISDHIPLTIRVIMAWASQKSVARDCSRYKTDLTKVTDTEVLVRVAEKTHELMAEVEIETVVFGLFTKVIETVTQIVR